MIDLRRSTSVSLRCVTEVRVVPRWTLYLGVVGQAWRGRRIGVDKTHVLSWSRCVVAPPRGQNASVATKVLNAVRVEDCRRRAVTTVGRVGATGRRG